MSMIFPMYVVEYPLGYSVSIFLCSKAKPTFGHCNCAARVKPYTTDAKKVTKFRRDEMPWMMPNCLFNANISCECGAGS